MAEVRWLHVGPDPYLATCERCGKHVDKPPLPAPADAFVAYLRYAEKLHAHCKAEVGA